jgi:GAF domain-containing protein
MADLDLAFAAMAEFAHTLVQRYGIADVLSELTDQIPPALGIFGAGVSVGDEQGVLRFVTASTDALLGVERMQEDRQEGPCVDAYHSSRVVTSDDLKTERRWHQYGSLALEDGLRSVAAVPLHVSEVGIGSLNLYAAEPGPWSEDTIRIASIFADMAASYLAHASDLQRSERVREQLQQALDSRVIIEQAKGHIAGQQQVTVDVAFERLRRYTRQHNARLHDVAAAVVNLGLRIDQ